MSVRIKQIVVCDQCGQERDKDTNHWWVLRQGTMFQDSGVQGIGFCPWDEFLSKNSKALHLCGLTCLYQAIDKLAQKILKADSAVKA